MKKSIKLILAIGIAAQIANFARIFLQAHDAMPVAGICAGIVIIALLNSRGAAS